MLPRLKALLLLEECTGVDIWPLDYCRQRGIPEEWLEQLADAFESGYDRDTDTIYFQDRPVNQFHGVLDFDLAILLGQSLGIDVERVTATARTPTATVRAIQEAVEEEI
ncbi:hypothetical protein SH139x_004948 [Planctomycetaceae bacterium SH139]